jgi:hypothetical protein
MPTAGPNQQMQQKKGLKERKKAEKAQKAGVRMKAASNAKMSRSVKAADTGKQAASGVPTTEVVEGHKDTKQECIKLDLPTVDDSSENISEDSKTKCFHNKKASPVSVPFSNPAFVSWTPTEFKAYTIDTKPAVTSLTSKPFLSTSHHRTASNPFTVTLDTRVSELSDVLPVPPGFGHLTFCEYYSPQGYQAAAVRKALEADLYANLESPREQMAHINHMDRKKRTGEGHDRKRSTIRTGVDTGKRSVLPQKAQDDLALETKGVVMDDVDVLEDELETASRLIGGSNVLVSGYCSDGDCF